MRSGEQNDSHPQRPNWESKKGEQTGKTLEFAKGRTKDDEENGLVVARAPFPGFPNTQSYDL